MYIVLVTKNHEETDRLQTKAQHVAKQAFRDFENELLRSRYQGRIIVRLLDDGQEIQHKIIR